MHKYQKQIILSGFLLLCVIPFAPARAQFTSLKLLGDFPEGWQKNWIERDLFSNFTHLRLARNEIKKPTRFLVVEDDDEAVLKVESDQSASSLWYSLNVTNFDLGKIKWRWKVKDSFTGNKKENQKVGDDYAARIYVVFAPHLVSWKTRAICYVWAGRKPVGNIYKSPYSSSVATVVVESGNENAGKWVAEERNFVSDYKRIFGKKPALVSAVVIMVDTDNTQSVATTWFDDIALELWSAPQNTSHSGLKRNAFIEQSSRK